MHTHCSLLTAHCSLLTALRRLPQFLLQILHRALKFRIGINHIIDRTDTIDHGGVVAATKTIADGFEGMIGDVFGKIHGQLTRQYDIAFPRL